MKRLTYFPLLNVYIVTKSSFPLSRPQTRTQNSLSRGWICLKVVAKMYLENGQEQVKTLIRSCQ